MFLKNRNIISKIRKSNVTDYAALRAVHVQFLMGNTYIMFICIYVILFGRRYLYILNNTDPHFQGKMFNKYNYKKKTDIGDVSVPLML